jgi:hypothetical protein
VPRAKRTARPGRAVCPLADGNPDRSRDIVAFMDQADPELVRLLNAERLAFERCARLRGYPADIQAAAQAILTNASEAVRDYRAKLGLGPLVRKPARASTQARAGRRHSNRSPKDCCDSTCFPHTRLETRGHLRFGSVLVCDGQHDSAKIFDHPKPIYATRWRISSGRRLARIRHGRETSRRPRQRPHRTPPRPKGDNPLCPCNAGSP